MDKRSFLLAAVTPVMLVVSGCAAIKSPDRDARRQSIDADIDNAFSMLFERAKGSRQMVERAEGVLVFPSVVAAGLVVGGAYGEGALRRGRSSGSLGYYSSSSASIGLTLGAQTRAVFVLFMTEESLKRFQASNGWTIGADASVALISNGANAAIDTQTARAPVVGFVVTNTGLIADLSLESTKVKKLDL